MIHAHEANVSNSVVESQAIKKFQQLEYIRLEIDKEPETLNEESDDEDGDDDGEEDEAEEFEPDLDENDILPNHNVDHLLKYLHSKQRKPSVDIFRPATPSQRR